MWVVNIVHLFFLSCLTALLAFSNFTLFYCKSHQATGRCPQVKTGL